MNPYCLLASFTLKVIFICFAKVYAQDKEVSYLEHRLEALSITNEHRAKEYVDSLMISTSFQLLSPRNQAVVYKTSSLVTLKLQEYRPQIFPALSDARKALQLSIDSRDIVLETRSLDLISGCFYHLGESYRDSMDKYIELSFNNVRLIPTYKDSLSCLAEILATKALSILHDDAQESYHLLERSNKIFSEIGNEEGLARTFCNLSVASIWKIDDETTSDESALALIDSAIIFLGKAISIYEAFGNTNSISNYLKVKGDYFFNKFYINDNLSELDSVIVNHRRAIIALEDKSCSSFSAIGEVFHWRHSLLDDNSRASKAYKDSAKYYYYKTIQSATEEEDKDCLRLALKNYFKIMETIKKNDTVVSRVFDALEKISEREKLALQESESEIRKFRLTLQQKENARRQSLFLTGVGVFLAIITALVLIFYQRIRIRHLQQQLRSKLERLRAQVDPHFISNCLNAIELLINENKPRKAADYLIEFSRLCRGILYSSTHPDIKLSQEIEYLENYISLEQLRLGDKLDYEFLVDPKINPETVIVPTLLIQPYIENAIWHGIQKKENAGKLTVAFEQQTDSRGNPILYCKVEDDGIGREAAKDLEAPSVIAKEESYGLAIAGERIQILDRMKDVQQKVTDLFDENGYPAGTLVEIWLPISYP